MPNRFIIQKSSTPNHWVCTDTENNLVCVFENGKFNDTQKFSFLEEINHLNATKIARIVNEMAEWLRANHYKKVMP
ncbi:MAG: hypothetical protein LKI39_02755 [Bacteroides sp.]|jgi:hypothetical protein|nr:hypothetical protein [Bacteroides sp.]